MKIRALKSFEGIKDNERNVFPKAGDVWETSEERANFLKSHGVIEFVEEEKAEPLTDGDEIETTIGYDVKDELPTTKVEFKSKKKKKK